MHRRGADSIGEPKPPRCVRCAYDLSGEVDQ